MLFLVNISILIFQISYYRPPLKEETMKITLYTTSRCKNNTIASTGQTTLSIINIYQLTLLNELTAWPTAVCLQVFSVEVRTLERQHARFNAYFCFESSFSIKRNFKQFTERNVCLWRILCIHLLSYWKQDSNCESQLWPNFQQRMWKQSEHKVFTTH